MIKSLLITFFCVAIVACNLKPTKSNPYAEFTAPCPENITAIIRSSNYKTQLADTVTYRVDDVRDQKIFIQVLYKNEDKRDVTVSWLSLDPDKGELLDETIDPETQFD